MSYVPQSLRWSFQGKDEKPNEVGSNLSPCLAPYHFRYNHANLSYALFIAQVLLLLRHGLGYTDALGKRRIVPTLSRVPLSQKKHLSLESVLTPSGLCEA